MAPPPPRDPESDDDLLEGHYILRVPTHLVHVVNDFIENGDQYDPTSPNNVERGQSSMKFRPDDRNVQTGDIVIGEHSLRFVMQELPTIVETHVTTDNINVTKVANCTHIIDCTVNEKPPGNDENAPVGDKEASVSEAKPKKTKKLQKIVALDGLTPPMRNAHKRRFRKTRKPRPKIMSAAEVEKELKRILRADLEATDVRVEYYYSSDEFDEQDVSIVETEVVNQDDSNVKTKPVEQDALASDLAALNVSPEVGKRPAKTNSSKKAAPKAPEAAELMPTRIQPKRKAKK